MLKINEATKSFAGIVAVDKCSFEIKQGTISALIGPNGAGKTTMFNCISHICHIDSGQIFYNNHRLDLMPTHKIARLGIGRSFQITRTLDQLSVTENLVLHTAGGIGSNLFHQDITPENRLKACEVMEFLGISTLADVDMGELSFGQKKLLDLGAVLMADPDLILLDEPAAGVNLRLLEDIINKLVILKNQGKTILLIEHNMDLVMGISDEVIVMSAGNVIAQGKPSEIQKNTEVLEAYLGGKA
jgi:ABC-type branched-subunit amino acid transport system ATPase component